MNGFFRGTLLAALSGIALALVGCGGGGGNSPGASAPTAVVPPLPLPGPYAVACSNIVQDFSRLGAGEDVQGYWEGVRRAPAFRVMRPICWRTPGIR